MRARPMSFGRLLAGGAVALALGALAAASEREAAPAIAPVEARAAPPRLGVLSFNMQHRDRPEELRVLAARLEQDLDRLPDFILCQEVLFQRHRSRGEDNTAAVLADLLEYRCHGTKRLSDREGLAILSRHPFVYWSQLDLEANTSRLLLGFKRVSVMGEFLVPGVGRVRVVNVHLTNWPFEHHVRRRQLQETLDWIERRQLAVPAAATVMGGDFNIEPDWSEMDLVTAPRGPVEVRFEDRNTARPTRGPAGRPASRVDYIFVSSPGHDLALLDERLLFVEGLEAPGARRFWLSDHVLLLHEYALSAPVAAARAAPAGRGGGRE